MLLLFLLPWAPLLVTLRPGEIWADRRTRFLAGWVVGSMFFFSISVNKLPGYILPVLPPLAILLGIGWVRRPSRFAALVAIASLLLVPLVAVLLPVALADGFSKAWAATEMSALSTIGGISVVVVAATAFVTLRFTDIRAIAAIALAATLLLTLLKFETYPAISQVAGARELDFEGKNGASDLCIGDVRRHTEYGLRFYSKNAIPLCEEQTANFAITGDPPRIETRP